VISLELRGVCDTGIGYGAFRFDINGGAKGSASMLVQTNFFKSTVIF
jgi:hypothetical protein